MKEKPQRDESTHDIIMDVVRYAFILKRASIIDHDGFEELIRTTIDWPKLDYEPESETDSDLPDQPPPATDSP